MANVKTDRIKVLESTAGSAVAQLDRPIKDVGEQQAFTAVNSDKREVEVIIILEGPGNDLDKHWYSAQAIADGVKKFSGARAYLNHQTAEEMDARPEQDVMVQAGFYKDTYLIPQTFNAKLGRMVTGLGATFIPSATEAGEMAFGLAKSQILWRETFPDRPGDCFAAISINSGGQADEEPLQFAGEDWINVTSFEDVRSADIVTRPGAGGAFVRLSESMSGVPDKNQEGDMKTKKFREAVKLLEDTTKAWKAERDAKKKLTLEAKRDEAQSAFSKLLEAEDEAEKKEKAKKEGEEEAEPEPGEDGAVDPMDALKKHVPQQDGEDDQVYADRLGAVAKHAGDAAAVAKQAESEDESEEDEMDGMPPKKGPKPLMQQSAIKRHRESVIVKEFRTKQPRLFTEVMTSMRETLNVERADMKTLKNLVESQASEIGSLRLERDLGVCEKLLTEAGIPSKYLSAGKLLKLDESERKIEIERTLMIMEGGGAARVFSGGGPGSMQGDDTGFVGMDALGTSVEG